MEKTEFNQLYPSLYIIGYSRSDASGIPVFPEQFLHRIYEKLSMRNLELFFL